MVSDLEFKFLVGRILQQLSSYFPSSNCILYAGLSLSCVRENGETMSL